MRMTGTFQLEVEERSYDRMMLQASSEAEILERENTTTRRAGHSVGKDIRGGTDDGVWLVGRSLADAANLHPPAPGWGA